MLGEHYEVLAPIGTGAAANVFRVRDTRSGAVRAAKVLKTAHASNPEIRARFEDEFRILRTLHHPHLPEVYDYGWTADDGRFLVMELVEGEPLDRYFQAHPEDIWVLLYEICETLVFVHGRNLLHQDIKPSNILVTRTAIAGGERPSIKLIDFGLTYRRGTGAAVKLVGTAEYVAPEVVRGEKNLTRAVDYYSLGATLFELLCGAPPFSGSESEILRGHLEREPVIEGEALEWAELYPHVRALLRKDVPVRLGAFEEFRRAVVGRLTGGIEDLDRSYALARIDSLGMIGKQEAWDALRPWLASLSGDAGSHTVSLSGGEGVGKRFLLGELRAEAAIRGVRTLAPSEIDTPRAGATVARQPALMWSRLLEMCEKQVIVLVVERPASLPDEERSFVRLAGTQWELMRSRGRLLPLFFVVAADSTTDDADVLDYLPSEAALKIELGAMTDDDREEIVSQFRGSVFDSRDARALLTYLARFEEIGGAVQGLQQAVLRSALTFVGQRWKVQPRLLTEMAPSTANESFSRDLVASLAPLERRMVAVVAAHPQPVPAEWVAEFAGLSTDDVSSIVAGTLKRLCIASAERLSPATSSIRGALRIGSDAMEMRRAHEFLVSKVVLLEPSVARDRALAHHYEQLGAVRDAARVHLRLLRSYWSTRPRERPYELIEATCRSGLELLDAHGGTVTVPARRHLFCFYLKQWINALWARNLFTHAKPIIDEWTKRLGETIPASVAPRYVRSVLELEGPEAALASIKPSSLRRPQLELRLRLEEALAIHMQGAFGTALSMLDGIATDRPLNTRDRYRLQVYRAMNLDEVSGIGSMQEMLDPLAEQAYQSGYADEASLIYALKVRSSISRGKLEEALRNVALGLRISHKTGLALRENLFFRLAATTYAEMQRTRKARSCLQRALQIAGTIGMRYVVGTSWARLVWTETAAGRFGNALRYGARALDVMGDSAPEKELSQARAALYGASVLVRHQRRDIAGVAQRLRNAKGSNERAYYYLWRGRDLAFRRQSLAALHSFKMARKYFVAAGFSFNLVWVDLQVARVYLSLLDRRRYLGAMKRARIATDLRARPLLYLDYRVVELRGRYLFRNPSSGTLALADVCYSMIDDDLDVILRVELLQTLFRIYARAGRMSDACEAFEKFSDLVGEISGNLGEGHAAIFSETFSLPELIEDYKVMRKRVERGDLEVPPYSLTNR